MLCISFLLFTSTFAVELKENKRQLFSSLQAYGSWTAWTACIDGQQSRSRLCLWTNTGLQNICTNGVPKQTKTRTCTDTCGCRLFYNTNYEGTNVCYTADAQFWTNNLGHNDKYSSISVNGNYRCTLYRDDDFIGPRSIYTSSTADLGSFDNIASAIRVEAPCEGCLLYYEQDFRGTHVCFTSDAQLWSTTPHNDKFRSLRVEPGYRCGLYEYNDFISTRTNYESDASDLGNLDLKVSAIRVEPPCPCTLYYDKDFRGTHVCYESDAQMWTNNLGHNDKFQSVRVQNGYTCELFAHDDFIGNPKHAFTADEADLSTYGLAQEVSAIKVSGSPANVQTFSNSSLMYIGFGCVFAGIGIGILRFKITKANDDEGFEDIL